ncbi:hypothetical protein ACQ4PT_027812 [Festuca glaucescens]
MDASDGMRLPYDLLLDILLRLPCRALANSRRVCNAWRAIVDAHDLLLPYFFPPRVFPGVFTHNFGCQDDSYFLAPPASTRRSGFQRPLFRHGWAGVDDHCNGLLLLTSGYGDEDCGMYVCNPATKRLVPTSTSPSTPPCPCTKRCTSFTEMFSESKYVKKSNALNRPMSQRQR